MYKYLRGNSSSSKTYVKGAFLSKNCSCFGFLFDRKIPIEKAVWTCINLRYFGNMSVRNAKLLWWNKSESENDHFLSELVKVWISILSGHRLNFPALELFDKNFLKFIFSIKKLKSSSLTVYKVSKIPQFFVTFVANLNCHSVIVCWSPISCEWRVLF